MTSKLQYWFGEKHWKVPQLTYCTFNAFSKIDLRVTVHIPGKFEMQIIGQDGKLINDNLMMNNWINYGQKLFLRRLLELF